MIAELCTLTSAAQSTSSACHVLFPCTKIYSIFNIMSEYKSVLPEKYSKGPHGLGDPDDRSLRKVEVEVVIPKLIRDKAKKEKCIPEVAQFEKCCKDTALLMVVKCRPQNSALKECLANWYRNEEFKQLCTEEYLKERSEYRRTGEKKPMHRLK